MLNLLHTNPAHPEGALLFRPVSETHSHRSHKAPSDGIAEPSAPASGTEMCDPSHFLPRWWQAPVSE